MAGARRAAIRYALDGLRTSAARLLASVAGKDELAETPIECDSSGNLSRVGSLGCGTITTTGNLVLSTALATVDGRDVSVDGSYLDLLDDYWRISGGVVSNSGSLAAYTDDLVFGGPQLTDDGDVAHDDRMYFDKSQYAFRAGRAQSTQWDSPGAGSFACGRNCNASGDWSTAFGSASVASGDYTVAYASGTASANYSFAAGYLSTAGNTYATVFGYYGSSSAYGELAIEGTGRFAAAGDAQASLIQWRKSTTDGTANVELFTNGSTTRFPIASDSTVGFVVYVVARRTDVNGESYFVKHEGCIDNNAGTTALVGTVTTTVIADDSGGVWQSQVSADNANDSLKVDVTGAVGKSIYWLAYGWVGKLKG